ncbi:unnamed protein product [marine sediment metagenome]|uniref:Uncharacterized protein n=1 Tax=marine sediment metagenome TaxID=412755 RepID=X1IS78_9ZZZZ
MKVKIKDLEPNPFRDMDHYPINPEKIESLKNSISQTGFWDNILARKSNGKDSTASLSSSPFSNIFNRSRV